VARVQFVDDGVAARRDEYEDLREHVGDDQRVELADGRGRFDAGTLLAVGGHVTLHSNGDPLQCVVRRLTNSDDDDDRRQLSGGPTVAADDHYRSTGQKEQSWTRFSPQL